MELKESRPRAIIHLVVCFQRMDISRKYQSKRSTSPFRLSILSCIVLFMHHVSRISFLLSSLQHLFTSSFLSIILPGRGDCYCLEVPVLPTKTIFGWDDSFSILTPLIPRIGKTPSILLLVSGNISRNKTILRIMLAESTNLDFFPLSFSSR